MYAGPPAYPRNKIRGIPEFRELSESQGDNPSRETSPRSTTLNSPRESNKGSKIPGTRGAPGSPYSPERTWETDRSNVDRRDGGDADALYVAQPYNNQSSRTQPMYPGDEQVSWPATRPTRQVQIDGAGVASSQYSVPVKARAPEQPQASGSWPALRFPAEKSDDEGLLRRIVREEMQEALARGRDEMREAVFEAVRLLPGPSEDLDTHLEAVIPVKVGTPGSFEDADTFLAHTETTRRRATDQDTNSDNTVEESFKMTTARHDSAVQSEIRELEKYLPRRLVGVIEWFLSIIEPERTGFFADVVSHKFFESFCMGVIVLNALQTTLSTNHEVANHGHKSSFLEATDGFFLAFYSIELTLKIIVHRAYFFVNENMSWNIFDSFLVAAGLYGKIEILVGGTNDAAGVQLVFLRMLRLLKMVRVLRMFRLMRSMVQLRMILHAILGSVMSLFWSIVMMCLIFFMFSLALVQSAATYLAEQGDRIDANEELGISENFGSVQKCMLGLFMATTGGQDWTVYWDAIQPAGGMSAFIYLLFVAFTQIALMNILTGIFVENAIKLAQPDPKDVFLEERRTHERRLAELEEIAMGLDKNRSGFIGETEFVEQMNEARSHLRIFMGVCGVHEVEALRYFRVLQAWSSNNRVSVDQFVSGCLKLQGEAQSLDLQFLSKEVQLVHRKINKLTKSVQKSTQGQNPRRSSKAPQANAFTTRAQTEEMQMELPMDEVII